MVGEGRLELPASWSQTRRATNCATPRGVSDNAIGGFSWRSLQCERGALQCDQSVKGGGGRGHRFRCHLKKARGSEAN